MGRVEKAKWRLRKVPKDYTFHEAKSLLINLGFEEYNKGKTSGSRVIFIKANKKILLHTPHPGDEMKLYAVRQLKEYLERIGEL